MAESAAGRMNKLAEQDWKARTGVVTAGPVLELSCFDCHEARDEGAHRDTSFTGLFILPVKSSLHVKQPISVGAECLFQPECHFSGQRGLAVEEVRQGWPPDSELLGGVFHGHARWNDARSHKGSWMRAQGLRCCHGIACEALNTV